MTAVMLDSPTHRRRRAIAAALAAVSLVGGTTLAVFNASRSTRNVAGTKLAGTKLAGTNADGMNVIGFTRGVGDAAGPSGGVTPVVDLSGQVELSPPRMVQTDTNAQKTSGANLGQPSSDLIASFDLDPFTLASDVQTSDVQTQNVQTPNVQTSDVQTPNGQAATRRAATRNDRVTDAWDLGSVDPNDTNRRIGGYRPTTADQRSAAGLCETARRGLYEAKDLLRRGAVYSATSRTTESIRRLVEATDRLRGNRGGSAALDRAIAAIDEAESFADQPAASPESLRRIAVGHRRGELIETIDGPLTATSAASKYLETAEADLIDALRGRVEASDALRLWGHCMTAGEVQHGDSRREYRRSVSGMLNRVATRFQPRRTWTPPPPVRLVPPSQFGGVATPGGIPARTVSHRIGSTKTQSGTRPSGTPRTEAATNNHPSNNHATNTHAATTPRQPPVAKRDVIETVDPPTGLWQWLQNQTQR